MEHELRAGLHPSGHFQDYFQPPSHSRVCGWELNNDPIVRAADPHFTQPPDLLLHTNSLKRKHPFYTFFSSRVNTHSDAVFLVRLVFLQPVEAHGGSRSNKSRSCGGILTLSLLQEHKCWRFCIGALRELRGVGRTWM